MSSHPTAWPPRRTGPEYRAWRQTQKGITLLRAARDAFKAAGSRQTLTRVRKALTSAGGAERHAYGLYVRSWRPR